MTRFFTRYWLVLVIGLPVIAALAFVSLVDDDRLSSKLEYRLHELGVRTSESLLDTEASTVRSTLSPVRCPATYKSIAIFGQSNASNRVQRSGDLKSLRDGKTFIYDWVTRKCYPFSEPVAGADGTTNGHSITETVEHYRGNDPDSNLILIAFARSGSSIFRWANGNLLIRLEAVLNRLSGDGIRPDLFLWHQGEADAMPEILAKLEADYSGSNPDLKGHYSRALQTIIGKVQDMFENVPVGVAIASLCEGTQSEQVRSAQKEVIEQNSTVFLSSNTDELGPEYRYDGCHFKENAARLIGSDYSKLFSSILK